MVKVIFGGLLPLIVMAANFVGYAVCSTLFRGMIEPPTLMLMMLVEMIVFFILPKKFLQKPFAAMGFYIPPLILLSPLLFAMLSASDGNAKYAMAGIVICIFAYTTFLAIRAAILSLKGKDNKMINLVGREVAYR
ncbi:MAG: hypothetical protein A3H69_00230 [Candidatus Sungbacteria bacterium RIFCSPLOWO2_02_FULL_47_9]|uniref:Uncharacterized protein n=1 Tax=Candidatus Sungbacteria bacterium RIFCSPHIGHO2_01_FULL_47_32 TaxID=1802264 RepID=A0A1G2K7W8_9BACT|nr:MAG: hypothetical protein UX72_C0034G0014 [Parcubacteria group bacterium GW2011_GWA2_47_10]OGZ95465.1 MAG: hypothetical protein A2633_03625 [Candidatus Sungbacteria bacterium RIFCSPHIGHO2_01_FULL_47_32]OGZ99921.1 MAG: hypothetical protein A3D57_03665 [Candidatus Sungbacteria bacterium RIFCSPHIGHO2_02_FULL_46_12]OHA05328.1 MAG: hypothetical protein A3A28_00440 [Candidatus Sungbacteria bacterium RIFCSPLOWO2_01_FULL_47_32]OHA10618.1 MAG: hypothetical protein A3H69_00230 [Candidatus Sungbacteria